jgi:Zn-dependent protease with chaperone function
MNMGGGLLKALLVSLAIPAVGYLVSAWIIGDINSGLAKDGLPSMAVLCADAKVLALQGMRRACNEHFTIKLLGDASIFAAILGVTAPVLYIVGSFVAGKSRSRLASIFPPLVFISLLLISLSVLLQGAILTFAAYIGEIYAIERVHYFLIGGIGLGALFGAVNLISASFSLGKKLTTQAIGKSLTETEAPNLFAYVRNLAEKLGARSPQNIVVGLEPTFYVTSSNVEVIGEDKALSGETLFISAPLTRLMSKSEFPAIIGHELGHFRGEDTAYSVRFAPVYAGLGKAIISLDEGDEGGLSKLAKLPAIAILSFMHEVFSRNERTIGRQRELLADQAGSEVSSPLSLSTSLAKVALYSSLWNHAQEQNIDRLNDGKVTANLSEVFQDIAKYDVEQSAIEDILDSILDRSVSHPTDTHPPIRERLDSLGIDKIQITKEALLVPKDTAIELVDGCRKIEEELTILEHRLMVALGHVDIPDEDDDDDEEEPNYMLRCSYFLAAAMVTADGKIEPAEITMAEGIGKQLFGEDFDSADFRQICNHPDDMPEVGKVIEIVNNALEEDGKILILKYLKAISESDEGVDVSEADLLAQIAEGWDIDLADCSDD